MRNQWHLQMDVPSHSEKPLILSYVEPIPPLDSLFVVNSNLLNLGSPLELGSLEVNGKCSLLWCFNSVFFLKNDPETRHNISMPLKASIAADC